MFTQSVTLKNSKLNAGKVSHLQVQKRIAAFFLMVKEGVDYVTGI